VTAVEWVNVFSCHILLEVDPRKLMRVLKADVWKPERLLPLFEKLQQEYSESEGES